MDKAPPEPVPSNLLERPLTFVFWGALLCIFDFTLSYSVNGQGIRFDVLNDAVGTLLIAWGIHRLRQISVSERYATAMTFVLAATIVAMADAVFGHFIIGSHPLVGTVRWGAGIVQDAGIVLFCFAMRWLCESLGLFQSESSWRMTIKLMIVLYVIPRVMLQSLALLATIASIRSAAITLGVWGIVLALAYLIACVHLLVSVRRTQQEAATRTVAHAPR